MSRLTGKNECLKRWNALAGWSQAANDQLSHVLQQLEGQKPGAQELAHLLGEADEVQIQCEAQLSQYADLDQLTSSREQSSNKAYLQNLALSSVSSVKWNNKSAVFVIW